MALTSYVCEQPRYIEKRENQDGGPVFCSQSSFCCAATNSVFFYWSENEMDNNESASFAMT